MTSDPHARHASGPGASPSFLPSPSVLVLTIAGLAVGLLTATVTSGEDRDRRDDAVVSRAVDAVSVERLRADLTALVGFGTRHTRSDTASETRGIGAARRWLHEQLQEIAAQSPGEMLVESQAHVVPAGRRMPVETEVVNVVATIPGSDPGRVIIVSGHYDSRNSTDENVIDDAPGANDDGSGTALVVEAARAISQALGSAVPRASIRFACVAGEEQGLYGSHAMAADDREAGTDVVAMLTNDIVGGIGGGNGRRNRGRVRLFSEGVPSGDGASPVVGSDNDAPSRQVARYIAERTVPGMEIELVLRQDRYLRGGDHRAYNLQGFAGVRLTDMYEHFDRQHQDVRTEDGREYGDVLEHIDFENLADVTRINVAAIVELALAPPAPAGVTVDVSELSHDTRLLWDDPGDPGVAGYRVRMRPTWAPKWDDAMDAGDVHEVTLTGISKDDVLFAVEAYDADGRTSLMVYPTPGG